MSDAEKDVFEDDPKVEVKGEFGTRCAQCAVFGPCPHCEAEVMRDSIEKCVVKRADTKNVSLMDVKPANMIMPSWFCVPTVTKTSTRRNVENERVMIAMNIIGSAMTAQGRV